MKLWSWNAWEPLLRVTAQWTEEAGSLTPLLGPNMLQAAYLQALPYEMNKSYLMKSL